ncbi:unnamed protein product [Closterium sp. NIES-65]|nr:unnamed protein product [Closterium sp. NIES-65]
MFPLSLPLPHVPSFSLPLPHVPSFSRPRPPSLQVGLLHSSLHFFQTHCAINPGSSGSPLVNEFGEVRAAVLTCFPYVPYAACLLSHQPGQLRQSPRERVWRGGCVLHSQSSAEVCVAVLTCFPCMSPPACLPSHQLRELKQSPYEQIDSKLWSDAEGVAFAIPINHVRE